MKTVRFLEHLLRLALGGVLFYAGIAKLADVQQFFLDVHHFELTPPDVSIIMAVFLPWLEIVAGAALMLRRFQHGALLLAGGMTLVFIAAIASAWWRGLDLTCGCFGHENNATNYPRHLAFNGAMLAAAVWLAWTERRAYARIAAIGRP